MQLDFHCVKKKLRVTLRKKHNYHEGIYLEKAHCNEILKIFMCVLMHVLSICQRIFLTSNLKIPFVVFCVI